MLQKSIGEIQNQVYGKWQMWDSSWQFHKNRKFNWSSNCANYLFNIILTDETGKKLHLFCANVIILMNSELTRKKLGHVKQTDICHYMVYSNIILNLSISSCYMVNHILVISNQNSRCVLVQFWNHAYDFDQTALSSILPFYMCLSFLLSISHSLLRSLSQYVINGCKGTELELSLSWS